MIDFEEFLRHNRMKLWILKDDQSQIRIEKLITLPDSMRSHYPVPIGTIQTSEILLITKLGWNLQSGDPVWVLYYDRKMKTFSTVKC